MKTIRQAMIIIVFTILSIILHEFGHFAVYRLNGYPVRVTLQSVKPVGSVNPHTNAWALISGPVASWTFAILFLFIAFSRPGFVWPTASLTNASIRLFPLTMDLTRAIKNASPFSDEGEVAMMIGHTQSLRLAMIIGSIVLSLMLSILSARQYHFTRNGWLKACGIYVFSLAIGIGVVIVDEAMR